VRALKADGLLSADTKLRSSKYLNNLIEQDHRGVKQCIARARSQRASQKPSRPASKATAMRMIVRPFWAASSRQHRALVVNPVLVRRPVPGRMRHVGQKPQVAGGRLWPSAVSHRFEGS
jgi:hypothetical protein